MPTSSRQLPNLGLTGFWALGEDGWNAANDANLLALSVLVQATVISRVASLPVSPSQGDVYLLTAGPHIKQIATYDNSAWTYITPKEGWQVYSVADAVAYRYVGGEWAASAVGVNTYTAAHSLALSDQSCYVQVNSATAVSINVPANSTTALPVGYQAFLKQAGAGQITVSPESGVTIETAETLKTRKQFSGVMLTKLGTNLWAIDGDLEAAP